jgi:flagellar hook-length control protein FliK
LNSQLPQNTAPDNTALTQAGSVEATHLGPALTLDQKTVPLTEKQTDGFSKDKPVTIEKQIDANANEPGLLEVQPKSNKSTESSDNFNAKTVAKLPQEAAPLPQATAISVIASSAITKVTTAQTQAGSANSITAYPGKAGWDQAISQKVVWMVGSAEQSATLTLNPPDLGPLQVVVSVNNDKADTTFISENSEVRKALENGIPTLRNLMGQAGIELGQTNVGTGKQQQEFQQAARERLASQMPTNIAPQSAEKQTMTSAASRINNGLVDTFA